MNKIFRVLIFAVILAIPGKTAFAQGSCRMADGVE